MKMKDKSSAKSKGRAKKSVPSHKLRSKLIFQDREGNITGPTLGEINKIAKAIRAEANNELPFLLEGSTSKEEKPANVTCLTEYREKKNQAITSRVAHGFLHDKAMAVSEFRAWKYRASQESMAGRKQGEQWHMQHLELLRLKADNGHNSAGVPPVNKKAADIDSKPVSTVFNPGLSSEPILDKTKLPAKSKGLDPKFWHPAHMSKTVLAPSGLPMRMFTSGIKADPPANDESSVVYTNDNSPQVRKALLYEEKMIGNMDWIAQTVETQFWDRLLYDYIEVREDDTCIVQTGAINKALAKGEEKYLLRAIISTLHTYVKWCDDEVKAAKAQENILEWELGVRISGNEDNAQSLSTPPVTDGALFAEYKTFMSLMQFEGPIKTFARYAYRDPSQAQRIERMLAKEEKYKRELDVLSEFSKRSVTIAVRKKLYREKLALIRIKNKVKLFKLKHETMKPVFDSTYYRRAQLKRLEQACIEFSKRGVRATPFNRKKPVNYQQVINDVVGVRSMCYSSPKLVMFHNKCGIKYQRYMNKHAARYYLAQSTAGKVTHAVKSGWNKAMVFMNQEVIPSERRRQRDAKREAAIEKANAKAKRRKLAEAKAAKDAARRAYRNAH